MAIVISGVNNNDKITASDGTIDLLSGVNYAGIITAPAFTTPGSLTAGHLNIGSGIQLGNAGIITATTLIGNVTGNVNHTSNLLLQISGSEKLRIANSGAFGLAGTNYGSSGQVLTSQGSGSSPAWSTITGTTINTNDDNRIITGSDTANTLNGESTLTYDGTNLLLSTTDGKIQLKDGNNYIQFVNADKDFKFMNAWGAGEFTFHVNGGERLRIASAGQIGLGGANYGSSGQALVSQGSGSAPQWATVASGGASNISFNSGYGIDFSADSHQSGMTSELLDDYEEGTWPGAINIGTATINQTNYVKIGRFVNATCFCAQMSPRNSGSGIQITGLPYAANGTYTAPIGLHRVIGDQGNGYFAYVSNGTTTIDILQNPWNQQGWKALAHNQIQHASAAYIIIAVSYQTS